MLTLNVQRSRGTALRILCLGAHSDDIEIGCGGLILAALQARTTVHVTWVVFSADAVREREARRSAKRFLRGARGSTVVVKQFSDGFFFAEGAEIKKEFERLKRTLSPPDIVFTHYRDDRHQDHRVISDLTWNTFRDHLVLEYETPKYDGDLGAPNCFMPLDLAVSRKKAAILRQAFATQQGKHWFSPETFLGLMRIRGVECRAPGGYAEAFYARKLTLAV